MVTILGALLGFLGSVAPDVLRLFQDRADKRYELAVLEKQIAAQKKGLDARLDALDWQAEQAVTQTLYQTYRTDIRWVDALNGTVRPVLAYGFFLLYGWVKWMQFAMLGYATSISSLTLLWTAEDQAIFAAIISFYYGQRAMRKVRQGQ